MCRCVDIQVVKEILKLICRCEDVGIYVWIDRCMREEMYLKMCGCKWIDADVLAYILMLINIKVIKF